jgi:ABC-type Fe3+ transport system permease subunit
MTELALRGRAVGALQLAPVILLGTLPVAQLVASAFAGSDPYAAAPWTLEARALALLGRSLLIAAGAAIGALALGLCVGIPLARLRLGGRGPLAVLLFATFAASPYSAALGWLRGDLASPAAQLLIGRPAAVAAVLATAHAPAVALLVLLAMRRVPVGWEEAGLLAAPWPRVLGRILLPQLAVLLGATGLVIFALCFSDHAVASLLQVPTYPIEVFLLYAGSFEPAQAARACLPLLALALAVASLLGALLGRGLARQWPAAVAGGWLLPHRERALFAAAALAVLAACTVGPVVGLVGQVELTSRSLDALRSGVPALGNSLATTAASVLLAIALGVAASGAIVRACASTRSLLAVLFVVPLCLPGSAFAIAWLMLLSEHAPGVREELVHLPAFVPALCIAARWSGPVALLVAGARIALPRSALDAARMQEGRDWRRLLRVELPLVTPVVLGAAAVLAALVQGATDILVMTAPPGFEVAPLRIDNLLHYGAREQAAALALASGTLAAGVPLAIAWVARTAWRRVT